MYDKMSSVSEYTFYVLPFILIAILGFSAVSITLSDIDHKIYVHAG